MAFNSCPMPLGLEASSDTRPCVVGRWCPSTASFVAGPAPLVLYDGQSSGLPTRASLWLPRVTRGGVPARLSGAHRLDGCAREPGSGKGRKPREARLPCRHQCLYLHFNPDEF